MRVAMCGRGAKRSAVIAVPTIAIIRRPINLQTTMATVKAEQHSTQRGIASVRSPVLERGVRGGSDEVESSRTIIAGQSAPSCQPAPGNLHLKRGWWKLLFNLGVEYSFPN
jgi:hypothetical protein